MRPTPDVSHDSVKTPSACAVSANCGGERRRMGFPSSMFFRKGDANGLTEETLITDGGWVRPSPAGWALSPEQPLELGDGNGGRLTAANGGGRRWSSGPGLQLLKKEPAPETIDSSEAAKKYGGRFSVVG